MATATSTNAPVRGKIVSFGFDMASAGIEAGSIGDLLATVLRSVYAVIQPDGRGPDERFYGVPFAAEVDDRYIQLTCACGKKDWVPDQSKEGLSTTRRQYECLTCGEVSVQSSTPTQDFEE